MKTFKVLLDKNSSNFLSVGVGKKFVKDAFWKCRFSVVFPNASFGHTLQRTLTSVLGSSHYCRNELVSTQNKAGMNHTAASSGV